MPRPSRDRAPTRPNSVAGAPPPRTPPVSPRAADGPATAAPERPLLRDPWGLITLAAVLPLLVKSLGAPLGEPFAEDFDFLQRALFGPFSLLDGGGSKAFWRPIPHQLYYLAFGRLMLAHPAVVAGIHVALLALASLLFYRAFRVARPGAWAAVVATAPLLSESTRTLIGWPSHFVDLGLWLFTALAAHEFAYRRWVTGLAALLGALLCKEVAVIAAVLLPLMPGIGPRDNRPRLRLAAACAAVAALWGVAYVSIRTHAQLSLPHDMEHTLATASWFERLGWSIANSLRAIMSLPLVQSNNDRAVGSLLALVALLWVAVALRHRRGRARWSQALAWVLWGGAWFLGASATLTAVYPFWMPNRSGFGSLGLLAMTAELAWTAHPMMLGAIVAARLVALGIAPAPPPRITNDAATTGAFMDFEQAVRLQRLMRVSRDALRARLPHPAPGTHIGIHYLPRRAEYAFGGSHAIRAWYADSTLEWDPMQRIREHAEPRLAAIIEFEPDATPQASIVEPAAMRAYLATAPVMSGPGWRAAGALLDRADSLERDPNARVFHGLVAGERSKYLYLGGEHAAAETEARRACALFGPNLPAHGVLGLAAYQRGDLPAALAHADSILKWSPGYPTGIALRNACLQAMRGQ